MPELPEVETTLRGITPTVVGAELTSSEVRNANLRWPVPIASLRALHGQVVHRAERRGKYLLLHTLKATVLLHLGMSGSLHVLPKQTPRRKHDHLDLEFNHHTVLRLNDPRRFGCCLVASQPYAAHPLLARLGPEPLGLEFDGEYLKRRAKGRRIAVKNLIMDSSVVVGVGNIYASESLFRAGIRPGLAAGRVSLERYKNLVKAIQEVLSSAIDAGGTTLSDFTQADGKPGYFRHELQVYGRAGEPCYICRSEIRSRTIGQRNTYYCPTCQGY